jgi:hypothetical protein
MYEGATLEQQAGEDEADPEEDQDQRVEPRDEALVDRWLAYRLKRVRDVVPSPSADDRLARESDNVVELPVRSPGRPRRTAP